MGGEERGPPGGTAALLDLVEEHRDALTWDFRRYLGAPLTEIGESVSYREAQALISELCRETGSHLYADLAGLKLAASQAEFAAILHAEWFMNANRDRELAPDPISLPVPFVRGEDEEDVTPEEYQAAADYLAQYSAFSEE